MGNLIIGCGYLGRRIAALWLEQGREVWATTRRPEAPGGLDVTPVVCDVLKPETLGGLPQADTVVYAIALDRSSGATMRSLYVDGLANVLARLPKPKRFLYISSSSVYGQTDGSWVDEESATEPSEEAGQIVRAAEMILQKTLPEAVILRFAGIYGPGRLLRQKAIQAGEVILADGDKWLNLIHVDDGARVALAAETHARQGRVYNVCDGHPVRRHTFYGTLAKHLGAPPPRFQAPAPGIAPPHEKANRRLRNRRLREELDCQLHYEDFEDGIRASI